MCSTFSVRYQSITKYRFGRPLRRKYLFCETPITMSFLKTWFQSLYNIGTMPRFVRAKTGFFAIILCFYCTFSVKSALKVDDLLAPLVYIHRAPNKRQVHLSQGKVSENIITKLL